MLENLVFLTLKRNYSEVFYHKEKYECDFVIKEGLAIIKAFQVTQSLKNPETKKREVRGLNEAMVHMALRKALLLPRRNRILLSLMAKPFTSCQPVTGS